VGDQVAAGAHSREVLLRQPDFTVSAYVQTPHYRQQPDTDHVRDGLLKAGLPD
jgi:adenylate cyclase